MPVVRRNRKPLRLRRGGDMHAVCVYLVQAEAYVTKWADPKVACGKMTRSCMEKALERLVAKKWVAQIGGVVQLTQEGLKALEQAS